MSRDHDSDLPAHKQNTTMMLNYNNDAQKRIGEMSADPMYCKYIKQETIENLQEFEMLDKLNEDNDNHPECTTGSDAKTQGIPEKEIGSKLEGPSDNAKTVPERPGMEEYITKTRITLEDNYYYNNPLEILPRDWIVVPHASGLPVYMHRPTRVCTLAKPYCIGTGSLRSHNIPMGAIPCYAYRRGLEEAKQQKMSDQIMHEQICNDTLTTDGISVATYNGSQETSRTAEGIMTEPEVCITQEVRVDGETGVGANESLEEGNDQASASVGDPSSLQPVPPPRVEPLARSWMTEELTPEQVTNYCKTLFHFKTYNVLHFKTRAARREYLKEKRTLQNPELPQGTKLSTVPAELDANCLHNKKYRMTLTDLAKKLSSSDPRYLYTFHEYVRRALHTQPTYELAKLEIENPSTKFQATIYIGDMKYGVGEGLSKREAKIAAARASIHILIPELKHEQHEPDAAKPDYSLFDCMDIEDPRVTELSHDAGEPGPYAVLRICLLRNLRIGQRIHVEITKMPCQKIKLIMMVGKHTATVVCKNQKTAKQRASQNILQKLHPQVKSWGSLLRMYGSRSVKSNREMKLEQRQLFLLQQRRVRGEPEPGVLGEPEPGVRGEPEPGVRGEPEPGVRGEPEPGVRGESGPGVRREPGPGVRGEPEPGVLGEPGPGVLDEPGPSVLDALRREMRRLHALDKARLDQPSSSNLNLLDF